MVQANLRHSGISRTAGLSQGRAARRSWLAALTSLAACGGGSSPPGGSDDQIATQAALRKCSRFSCRGIPTSSAEQVVLAQAVQLPVPRDVSEHRRHSTTQLTGRAGGQLATSSGTGPYLGVRRCTPGGGPSSRTARVTAGRLKKIRLVWNSSLGLRFLAFLRRTIGELAAWLTARAASSTAASTRCMVAAASSRSLRALCWVGETA